MVNITGSNFTMEGETRQNLLSLSRPLQVTLAIAIIFNGITCPLTVILNAMVITAIKKRPSLQTNANILLACLAATDVFTGLASQPSYILWSTFKLLGMDGFRETLADIHGLCLRVMTVCSSLHLMLVTFERLIAIRFTEHYPYIVIKRNIKVAVIVFWIYCIFYATFIPFRKKSGSVSILDLLGMLIVISCVLFIASSYVILYRETLRHRKRIKTQQLPQEEVQKFAKESKALRTTVLIVGAVVLCYLPGIAFMVLFLPFKGVNTAGRRAVFNSCLPCHGVDTFIMLNSIINPLIYCWRQKEMRQFVFRPSSFPVAPVQN